MNETYTIVCTFQFIKKFLLEQFAENLLRPAYLFSTENGTLYQCMRETTTGKIIIDIILNRKYIVIGTDNEFYFRYHYHNHI